MANTMQALFDQAKKVAAVSSWIADEAHQAQTAAQALYIAIQSLLSPYPDIAVTVVATTPAHKKALIAFDIDALDAADNPSAVIAAGNVVLAGIKEILDTRIRIGEKSTAVDFDTKKPRKKSR